MPKSSETSVFEDLLRFLKIFGSECSKYFRNGSKQFFEEQGVLKLFEKSVEIFGNIKKSREIYGGHRSFLETFAEVEKHRS